MHCFTHQFSYRFRPPYLPASQCRAGWDRSSDNLNEIAAAVRSEAAEAPWWGRGGEGTRRGGDTARNALKSHFWLKSKAASRSARPAAAEAAPAADGSAAIPSAGCGGAGFPPHKRRPARSAVRPGLLLVSVPQVTVSSVPGYLHCEVWISPSVELGDFSSKPGC